MSEWQDRLVGDRMAVDQEFSRRVAESEFSSQEWGLVMTAVEFRIENATDPEAARLVADTSKVEHVVPEMQNVSATMDQMAMGGPGGAPKSGSDGGGGLFSGIKDALGLGGGGGDDTADEERILRQADALTSEYADRLQERLENEGRWEEIRLLAAGEAGTSEGGETDADGPDTDDPDTDSADGGE